MPTPSPRGSAAGDHCVVAASTHPTPRRQPPDLYQVVIECRDEAQQRELFERFGREGLKVRLLCL